MLIKIVNDELLKIVEHAKAAYPIECCGLLAGEKTENEIMIHEAKIMKNIDNSNEHFTMDIKEQFEAIKMFRLKKSELIGNYHSHPETPARMSEEDKKLAFDKASVYAIISLQELDNPVVKFFKIDEELRVTEIDYTVIQRNERELNY